jgi:L-ascorbate metabolism protein UlaG (beta-lactamase superfamily)
MSLRVVLILLSLALGSCTGHRGAPSDHFDGERFFDPVAPFDKSWHDLWRYYLEREPGAWTRDLSRPPGARPPAGVADGGLHVVYVGHATTLIQVDGQNILTDPIWSERASPVSFAGPRRYTPPGIAFEDLPRIHVVLISHDHYDHLDLPTLQRLRAEFDPVFVVGLGQSALLRDRGFERTVELDWWQPWAMPNGCKLWGTPARHWTGRGLGPRNRSLWLSFVIETNGGPVYFAGDTGYGPQFREARERFGPMRYALLPIGAYKPRWLTDYQHLDPGQAVRAHLDLGAAASLGIHFGTFELADDGQFEPVQDLAAARAARKLGEAQFRAPEFGGGYDVPPLLAYPGCLP